MFSFCFVFFVCSYFLFYFLSVTRFFCFCLSYLEYCCLSYQQLVCCTCLEGETKLSLRQQSRLHNLAIATRLTSITLANLVEKKFTLLLKAWSLKTKPIVQKRAKLAMRLNKIINEVLYKKHLLMENPMRKVVKNKLKIIPIIP